MEGGNEVDLSNNNITPLWKRRTDSNAGKAKPRPHSYQIDGVLMTDFPVEENSNFKVSQAVENTVTSQVETMVLKHVFNKPARKTRVVRSISIGHQYSNKSPLSKTRSDSEQHGVDNPVYSTVDRPKVNNGSPQWINRHCSGNQQGSQKRLSSPVALISQKDQIVFGLSPSSPDHIWMKRDLPTTISNSSPLYSPDQEQARVPLPASDPPTPSSSSASPMSCTPSDPPTPSASSPEERGVGLWQSPESKALPAVVLSTHSLAAMKVGTQQLIPKGLASVVRTSKGAAGNPGTTGHLEPIKRAPRVRSMVETSSFFSSSGDEPEGGLDESGALKRGIRSTSYRRAVVSGIDLDVPAGPLKSHQLSQPILKGLQEEREPTISLGKGKTAERKKGLSTQRTFDSEGDEVLYQNYQEKALHNDSDSDGDSKLPQPDRGIVVQYRPLQSSWSQLSVVKKSRVCEKMTPEERKRQEAIFEVISSEHSYLHSLEILIRMFKSSTELSDTMTKTDHHHLFSNIVDVCEASKKFFKELEDRHQNNIVIDDISDIVEKHALSTFDPYVTYCSNEVYQQRTLQRLLTKNPAFKEALSRIEAHPDCRNLPMISFLILPMQRVTRLPLLMDTICQKTPKDLPRYRACKTALQSVSKLVRQCNEGARRMERTEMMYTINSQLGFKIKPFPLVSSSRWLVKRGELTAFVEDNGIFMRRTSRQLVYLFLFNDVFIITRKKSEESYTVMDYALKDHIQVESCQAEGLHLSPVRAPATMLTSRHPAASHLFRVQFCSNHSQEKVSMVLGAEHLNERARWISALGQSSSDKKNADRTKLKQVEVTRTYTAKQPDELSLQVADVVLVWQSVEDGWYEGQRLRDGECGWFPDECAEEITCQATVQRNMQRMERLQGLETNV